ncbi:hypothetical protein FACS1894142_5790 [Spirochaetia bacterium]|nr:hypothetical protein FACS1894142_5790 [Spirochaetia bacterium]
MDWRIELDKIYTILKENNCKELTQELMEAQLIGGTGGEIFIIMVTKFIEIKKSKQDIYNLIKNEVDNIINYAIKIKYIKKNDAKI